MNFCTSVFENSKIGMIARTRGSVMTGEIQLEGQDFVLLNGWPHFKFTEAISFVVNCETRQEWIATGKS
jgi:predicted 3-demethylubiquinone-9 3-methyltransferase (glyoxalase superfamily)